MQNTFEDMEEIVDKMNASFAAVFTTAAAAEAAVKHLQRTLEIGEPEVPEDY